MNTETLIRTESVRIPKVRDSYKACQPLAKSIGSDGMSHPITVWTDGTLISGGRRLFAHLLLGREHISAVFVNNIEDASKRLLIDNQDDAFAVKMNWSEVCRLWELLRRLDAPAAAKRLDAARRRGVELRRETQSGNRKPGRSISHGDDYFLRVVSEPFGIKSATARRIEKVYQCATGAIEATPELAETARNVMRSVDAGESIWSAYQRILDAKGARRVTVKVPEPSSDPVPAVAAPVAKQVETYMRVLSQWEGLLSGLVALGPPNDDMTWLQAGPIVSRLAFIRRETDKLIKQLKEKSKA